jgi:UDP-N-acetylglucosamine--N-acetylmuramyl-(pentapeptide) pyrophosphoryl-undecaprenol N-acetylglucosamine transferase
MKTPNPNAPLVAIACGGTGGHLFPGLAVARELQTLGCEVALLVSPKDVDQQAVKAAAGCLVHTLPALALQDRNYLSFAGSCFRSFLATRRLFRARRPVAVLAMGGFTSVPPVVAASWLGIKSFLHDSNAVPGRANRWLAPLVTRAFLGFAEASARLKARHRTVTGTPVRAEFQPRDAAECRRALGLDPNLPTLLVVGGSQGARGLNDLVLAALPHLKQRDWQWLHLTGPADAEKVRAIYDQLGLRAVVRPFLAEMEIALGAATAAVSRAGASSMAELAAVRLPALLVPLPTAADNHQFYNARQFAVDGAAWVQDQRTAAPEKTASQLVALMGDAGARLRMQAALAHWHVPTCARDIAAQVLRETGLGAQMRRPVSVTQPNPLVV